jgi:carboxyl-terminal processing protease
MAQKRRSIFFFPLVVLICSILGGVYGPRIRVAAAASSDDVNDVDASAKSFTRVYAIVEQNFADKLDPDKAIYKGAIPGMLRTLDPHSNFFDPHDFEALKDEQHGHYYGVGMTVQGRNGKTIVIAPFKGSPAYKAGIRPGDVINKVNGVTTDNLDTTKVADMLKGPRGTPVDILILREGSLEALSFHVIRDEINRESVRDAFWIKPGIAYVEIEQFIENTGRDLQAALDKLGQNNIKGLVLDLRFNPGGLLNEGIAVADQFLNKGDVVVSHHGHASPEKIYYAQHGNHGRNYPIVVLVNHLSASAAEIVSGALQDHDRAWILGETTFGKGLVQTVFPLAENTGLALTTYRYYTPSGRLIQRDYTNVSFFDYYYRNNTEARNDKDVKMTDSGRTVYGGGGITPDEKYTPPKLDALESQLARKYAFFNFTKYYFGAHSSKLPDGWAPDNILMTEFHDWLLKQDIEFSEADFTKDHDFIKRALQSNMYTTAFSVDESRRFDLQTDPMVEKAVESLPKAQALLDSVRKVMAQRMSH